MKEFAGGTFGLPCALVLRYLAEGEQHDRGLDPAIPPAPQLVAQPPTAGRAHRLAHADR